MDQIDFWANVVARDGRRAPGDDELTRRIGRHCTLGPDARVLDLGAGTGAMALLLAREHGCHVTCIDADAAALEKLKAAADADGLGAQIETQVAERPWTPAFEDGAFDAVVVEAGLGFLSPSFIEAVRSVRRLLATDGKLAVLSRARVGRNLPEDVVRFYREANVALELPGKLLETMQQGGFEPLACESLGGELIEAHLGQLELGLDGIGVEAAAVLREEIALRRSDAGRNAIDSVLLVARRREPHERPPRARVDG